VSAVPTHFEGWFNLGLAHQKSGRWQQAAESYEEALKQRPQSAESYTNLGIVREQLDDLAGAHAAYSKAVEANPEGLAPVWNLALLLEHTGRTEEAERYYRQILDKAPREEEARFRLGFLRLQRQDYRGAAEAFEGCLKYRPSWPEAHANLALAYSGMPSGFTRRCWSPIRSLWKRSAGWPPWRFRHPISTPRWSFTCA